MLKVILLSAVMLRVEFHLYFAACHYAEYVVLNVIVLNVTVLNVIMLNVIMLNVIMLC